MPHQQTNKFIYILQKINKNHKYTINHSLTNHNKNSQVCFEYIL
jgi:hypothetical protein